ncbi:carbohydrate esterase family 4 protein [Tilletiaria anomala UBC 951]|uniref:Carbohydrate esterase family 4 protein n=1 Tax=Tilletiaria anomala (strain ATCC 24038 / CBS 436.72 / UBC 951) TaxID=1037660 RepID=A0A066WQH8_TILAU|nr:carbohydrate esterase family 4 protein [Tilletiaria anomala UBC 951]KDN52855.1 carbohydrate esterase family 4 protein [Tilletiaria anomala UBC 951]
MRSYSPVETLAHDDAVVARAATRTASGPESGLEVGLKKRVAQLTDIQTNCTAPSCFSATFDDGPWIYTDIVARHFASAGLQTTFFVNGNNYDCIYNEPRVQTIRNVLALGHQIGSHTWSHASLVGLTFAEIDEQVFLLEEALRKIAGIVPAFIRPPYGAVNETIIDYLNKRHSLIVLLWTEDTLDSLGTSPEQSIAILNDTIRRREQAVVLQHDTLATTANVVVPQELQLLRANGYVDGGTGRTVRTVAQNFGVQPYKVRTTPSNRDSTWTCAGKPQPGVG